MANIDLYQLVSGAENPVSFVAAGDPAGKGTCHRAASQVFFFSSLFSLSQYIFRKDILHSHLNPFLFWSSKSSGRASSIMVFILWILRKSIHQLVAVMDPRTTQGDSLLHLSVSKSNTLKTQVCKCAEWAHGGIFFEEKATPINQNDPQAFFEDGGQKADLFPSLAVASLLVECGARWRPFVF